MEKERRWNCRQDCLSSDWFGYFCFCLEVGCWAVCVSERERDRQTDRQTQTERDRQTDGPRKRSNTRTSILNHTKLSEQAICGPFMAKSSIRLTLQRMHIPLGETVLLNKDCIFHLGKLNYNKQKNLKWLVIQDSSWEKCYVQIGVNVAQSWVNIWNLTVLHNNSLKR